MQNALSCKSDKAAILYLIAIKTFIEFQQN